MRHDASRREREGEEEEHPGGSAHWGRGGGRTERGVSPRSDVDPQLADATVRRHLARRGGCQGPDFGPHVHSAPPPLPIPDGRISPWRIFRSAGTTVKGTRRSRSRGGARHVSKNVHLKARGSLPRSVESVPPWDTFVTPWAQRCAGSVPSSDGRGRFVSALRNHRRGMWVATVHRRSGLA